ncbi:MAG: type I-G CRISPR-associated RAMP protein Csb1/Cas7g [Egibacteraceae bacterium]
MMTTNHHSSYEEHPHRVLATIALAPLQGRRFQPASYANLGPALFTTPDGLRCLQIDGHAAVANWLEATGWNDNRDQPHPVLEGLPFVRVTDGERPLTSSRTDSHRLASAYVLNAKTAQGQEFRARFVEECGLMPERPIDWERVARVCFRYDPLALLHGVFFSQGTKKEKPIPGNPKFARIVSGFVEAEEVLPASRGGLRADRVAPGKSEGRTAEQGYGHVPLPITDDYTAGRITLYWSLDRAALWATRLPEPARQLLERIGQWQLRRLVDAPIKPRTFCDLIARSPDGLPPADKLAAAIREGIEVCAGLGLFADPRETVVTWASP